MRRYTICVVMVVLVGAYALTNAPYTASQDIDFVRAPRGEAVMPTRYAFEKQLENFLFNQKIFGIRTSKIIPRFGYDARPDDYEVFTATSFPMGRNMLVTVNHIIRDPKRMEVMIDGKWKKLDLAGRVQTKDSAFFTFKNADFGKIALRFKTMTTMFNSFPGDQNTVPLDKVLIGMKCMEGDAGRIVIGELYGIQPSNGLFTFSIAGSGAGCSGAPVFSYDGYVIGVSQSGFERSATGIALDIEQVLAAFAIFQDQK